MNGIQKFLVSVFSSIIVIFLIWGIIFYTQHTELWSYPFETQMFYIKRYHLDLQATFNKFQYIFNGNIGSDFLKTLQSFKTSLTKFNNSGFGAVNNVMAMFNNGRYPSFSGGFQSILTAINALINPLYGMVNSVMVIGYLTVIGVQLFGVCFNVIWGFYEFIFNPVFIYVPMDSISVLLHV